MSRGDAPGLARQAARLGASYVLGTFNDNFFKQAALLLAIHTGYASFQSWATFLFALPFVVFSAWGGWLADRYSKPRVLVRAKLLEVAALTLGIYALPALDWHAMLAVIFLLGLNSALFNPALNGAIPELFPAEQVPRVNALFKLATTASILLGVILGGVCLDQQWWATPWPFGQGLVASLALLAAVLGLVSALRIPALPAVASANPFPRAALLDSCRHLAALRGDRSLFFVLLAEAFFYFLSTLLLLEINRLGVEGLGLSFTVTSLLSVALMLGICAGALKAARGTAESWRAFLLPALGGMALALGLAAGVHMLPPAARVPALLACYGSVGFCGGIYLIPLASYMQVHPLSSSRGRVLGLSNFLSFSAILAAGQGYFAVTLVSPAAGHAVLSALAVAAMLLFRRLMKRC